MAGNFSNSESVLNAESSIVLLCHINQLRMRRGD